MSRKGRPKPLSGDELTPNNAGFSWRIGSDGTFSKPQEGVKLTKEGVELDGRTFKVCRDDLDVETNTTIGRGGSSVVQKAYHKKMENWVAVKIMRIQDKEKRNQLLGDLKGILLHAAQPHENDSSTPSRGGWTNLVEMYGAYVDRGVSVHLVMEYMDRGSLGQLIEFCRIRKLKIPWDVLASICKQVVDGVAYLHGNALIHRDIKPQNILINSQGLVKVSDLGIARSLNALDVAKTFIGTSVYMSPELITGQQYNEKADIWSMGMVLYELVTLEPAMEPADSFPQLYESLVNASEPRLDHEYPETFREIIAQCLLC